MSTQDLGLEIVIEPNVVPKGTLDLRSLDAPKGAAAPPRRIEADGRVFALAPTAGGDPGAPDAGSAPTAVAPVSAVSVAPAPAAPAAAQPLPAPVAPADSPPRASGSDVASPKQPTDLAATGSLSLREAPEVDLAATGAIASGPRRKPNGSRIHADAAMPPRPASATETHPAVRRDLPPPDDYETNVISGGFASSIGTLVKVTAVLVFFSLATVLTALYCLDLWPWPTQSLAVGSQPRTDPAPVVSSGRPEKPPIEKPEPPKPVPADVAPPLSSTPTKPEPLAVVEPKPPAVEPTRPEAAPIATKTAPTVASSLGSEPEESPRVTATGVGTESDLDIARIEKLRKEAVLLARRGSLDEAMTRLDALLQLNPKDPDALFRRALVLHRKDDLPAALAAYETAAGAAAPRDARAFTNLGLVHERLGDLKAARGAYERGLAHDPGDPDILTNLGRLERDADPRGALARFEKALERDPRHPYARVHRADMLALALGRIDEGRGELEALTATDSPVRAEALDSLGWLAHVQGNDRDAERLFRRALEAKPALHQARLRLAVALFDTGQNRPAEQELRTYLTARPTSADGWKTLGAVLVRLDSLTEAKQAYEKAIELNDKDASTRYNYALCAERFGNFLFAIQEYERVVKLEPDHWKALTNLGRLYRRAGRDARALEYFDKALSVRPKEAELHLHRANALAALGRNAEARLALAEFVKLAPPQDRRVEQATRAMASGGDLTPATPDAPAGKPRGF